ncbi:MAG: NAD kinase [Erysipelothrix sp.]|jgi:NAD+ kinase|nr:NAD kinase [Erysipelothrix sp.]
MQRFYIVEKEDNISKKLYQKITQSLLSENKEIDSKNPQCVITVGGDGTFLHAVHQFKHLSDVVFVGLHTGTLGFFTDYEAEEIDTLIDHLLHQEPIVESTHLIEVKITHDQSVTTLEALNEIRVENIVRTQEINVYINHEMMEIFRGNGLCVSGQAGSTAYNRSLKGAIIAPGVDVLQLTEIAGIHHKAYQSIGSPLVLPKDTVITLISDNFEGAKILYDYHVIDLEQASKVEIKTSDKKVNMARYRPTSYIKRLHCLF